MSGETSAAGGARPSARRTVAVVAAAGFPGLVLLPAVSPIARWLDVEPGLVEYTLLATAWSLGVLAVLVVALPSEGSSLGDQVRWWWRAQHPEEVVSRPRLLWAAVALVAVVGVSPIRLWLIDRGWDVLAGPSWSVNSPAANRGAIPFDVGAAVVAFQLLVRIPLTVFVEETLFRGWVQDRHGPLVSAVLFACYHLAQWWTIGALVPFGMALSLLRVATRSMWPGAMLHAAGNVVYAVSLA